MSLPPTITVEYDTWISVGLYENWTHVQFSSTQGGISYISFEDCTVDHDDHIIIIKQDGFPIGFVPMSDCDFVKMGTAKRARVLRRLSTPRPDFPSTQETS